MMVPLLGFLLLIQEYTLLPLVSTLDGKFSGSSTQHETLGKFTVERSTIYDFRAACQAR